ncbi:cytochrome C [Aureimonas sp. Leaf454]|nr:cytochrome C [Aureimonas sp. Leaf454]
MTSGAEATPGEGGKFVDSAGNPIYAKNADGTFDYYTWRGYKKFMANCMQCHGPDGMGSSFAPNLTESLTRINYYDFTGIIVNGQQNKWHPVNSIMPAWGEDLNVMCFLDGIYVYLRGRADGAVPRGEPKKPAVNKEAQAAENACLGF